jgi:membrane protease YdiL (CAAX protease family)
VRRLGPFAAVSLSTVCFTAVHLRTAPAHVGSLVVTGALLGILAVRTGRIGPCIIAHSTFNGLVLLPALLGFG